MKNNSMNAPKILPWMAPQYGPTPVPRLSWMWRHQSRMSLMSLIATQNACRLLQDTWGNVCAPKKAA